MNVKYVFSKTDNNANKSDVWYTPISIIKSLGQFDLDPCGNEKHVTADKIYESEGLEKEWFGRVWLNPPYSQVGKWLDKLYEHGNGVALVFARTDTRWAQKHLNLADGVFFKWKRIKFINSNFIQSPYGAGHGSMILTYGHRIDWTNTDICGWIAK